MIIYCLLVMLSIVINYIMFAKLNSSCIKAHQHISNIELKMKENCKPNSIKVKDGMTHRVVKNGQWINNYVGLIEFDWFCYAVIYVQKTGNAYSTTDKRVNVTHVFTYFEDYNDALSYMKSFGSKLIQDYIEHDW